MNDSAHKNSNTVRKR